MDLLSGTLAALVVLATLVLVAFGLHGTLIAIFGAVASGATRRDRAEPTNLPRIAALVVAHDEERVIERSVQSLGEQRYPKDRFTVSVVADRCTDRTAEIAERGGASVLLRVTGSEGKTAALAFGVQAVLRDGDVDALAVFDADNVVDPDFLHRVGRRLALGERVVQGFVDAANPASSWVSGSSALGFWAIAALAQEPRERLGLSSPLMGTAFSLRAEDALRYLGDAESLTDDLELGARLALDGVRVSYEPGARAKDEKPVELGTAARQRHRWMQGRWAVAGRYLPRLLGRALARDVPLGARLRVLDVAVQLVAPSLSFTAVATLLVSATSLVLARVLPPVFASVVSAFPPGAGLVAGAIFYALPAIGIAKFRPPARVWLYYAAQPAYLVLSAPLALTGFLTRRSRTWKRTPKG